MCNKKTLNEERFLAQLQVLDDIRCFVDCNIHLYNSRYGQFDFAEALIRYLGQLEGTLGND